MLRGEFTLRSGRKSNYYLDKYLFETHPDILRELGKLLAARLSPEVDRIAGAELGAVILTRGQDTYAINGIARAGERMKANAWRDGTEISTGLGKESRIIADGLKLC